MLACQASRSATSTSSFKMYLILTSFFFLSDEGV